MRLNVIHLPHGEGYPEHRQKRWDNLMKELSHQKIAYRIWDGIKTIPGKIGCNQSHKRIIRDAKERELEYCAIAEDDICFYGSGAWDYFISNIPNDFDLYLGGYSGGSPTVDNIMKKFSSTTLFVCHNRFYDKFLGVPESLHIDNALSMTGGKFVVCNPAVVYQMPGFSETLNQPVDYRGIFNKKSKPYNP